MMRQVSNTQPTTLLNTTVVGQPWQSSYKLGLGVDAVTGQLRASAVKPFDVVASTTQNPEFMYSFIQAESDVQSLISASLKGSYNIEGITVSASTSFLDELAVSDLAVTLVAEVSIEDGQYSLAPSYELAVVPGPDFREKYGDYFVAGYRAGSSLYVTYQCRFTSTEQRTKFAAAVAAEVPQVFSTEGSSAFEKVATQHGANVSIHITAQGVKGGFPNPPKGSTWTAETIVSTLLPWFNEAQVPAPLESYLMSYRMIEPSISGEVPISPDVFSQVGYLYGQFWLARSRVKTCPEFGKKVVDNPFRKLEKDLEAYQSSLPTDVPKIEQFTAETQRLLGDLDIIANRQTFYTKVIAAAKTEPAQGENFDADNGRVRWGYGFQGGDAPGVDVASMSQNYSADWKIGWQENVFTFRDTSKVIVGWDVICNRTDHGGDWQKRSATIIGRNEGNVYVKSDYDRGCSWTIVWYTVDAGLYPAGPWTTSATHAPEFVEVEAPAGSLTATGVDVIDYWTPERMRAAEPLDRSAPIDVDSLSTETAVAPTESATASEGGHVGVQDGARTTRVQDPKAYPFRTVGKLFFDLDGKPRVASGVVVDRNGILTAAHCLLLYGAAASNLIFVPAYTAGVAPFGKWAIKKALHPTAWASSWESAWDVGLCTMDTDNQGRSIGDVVGTVTVRWAQIGSAWNDVGYPAKAIAGFPFDGAHQWQSLGARAADTYPSTVTKHDNMTAGGSGGPWFMATDPTVVTGVLSQAVTEGKLNVSAEFKDWVGTFYRSVFG